MDTKINIGDAVGWGYSTFAAYIGRLLPFVLIVSLVSGTIQLGGLWIGGIVLDGGFIGAIIKAASSILAQMLALLVTGHVAGAFVRIIRGEGDQVLPSIASLTSSSGSIRAVVIKIGIIIGGLSAVGGIVANIGGTAMVVLGGIIELLSIIPIIMLAVRWNFAPIVAVAEGADVDRSFARSEEMATGRFWNIVLLGLAIGICAGTPTVIVGAIAGTIIGIFLGLISHSALVGAIAVSTGIWAFVVGVGVPLGGAMLARAYADLNPGSDSGTDAQAPTPTATRYASMDAE